MIVRRAAQIHHPVERTLHEIERLTENLLRQFLDRFRAVRACGHVAKTKIRGALFPDHLQRTLFARQKREPQNFLAVDHPLDRRADIALGQQTAHLN